MYVLACRIVYIHVCVVHVYTIMWFLLYPNMLFDRGRPITLQEGSLSEQEYLHWAASNTGLSQQLPRLLVEVCHVRFGLHPRDSAEEATVVR